MVTVSYIYFLSKFTEFADTFFFLSRKKFEHVSLLQVTNKEKFASPTGLLFIYALAGDPPRYHAALRMGSGPLAPRRPRDLRWDRQLPRARVHVFLLLFSLSGTPHAKVFGLEKVPHDLPDAPGNLIPDKLLFIGTPCSKNIFFPVCNRFREEPCSNIGDSGMRLPVAVFTYQHHHHDIIFRIV